MATYTTYLELEKPTTSERLDVLKLNANSDKIDAGFNTLNSNISQLHPSNYTYVGGSFSVSSSLTNIRAAVASFVDSQLVTNGKTTVFDISLASNSRWHVLGRFDADKQNGSALAMRYDGQQVNIYRSGGTDTSSTVATSSDIATVTVRETVSAGTEVEVSYPTGYTSTNCIVISHYVVAGSSNSYQYYTYDDAVTLGPSCIYLRNKANSERTIEAVLWKKV